MEELSRQFKAGEINANQLKEAARDLIKSYGKDIGIDIDVVYLEEKTMPKKSKGSTGSSYIVDKENRKVLIPIDVSKIGDINELLGTLDNEYTVRKYSEDSQKLEITGDGLDHSNDNVGDSQVAKYIAKVDTLSNALKENSKKVLKLTGNNISAKDITENATALAGMGKYYDEIQDIIKNGDNLGTKTENLFNKIISDDKNLIVYDAKYGSNNGFDHLIFDKNTGTLWIIDSKQIARAKTLEAGAIKLSETGAGGFRQLSPKWIEEVGLEKLDKTLDGNIKNMIKNRNYKTAVVGVNKETGDFLFLPITVANK